jgi:Amt family ammonium transporter
MGTENSSPPPDRNGGRLLFANAVELLLWLTILMALMRSIASGWTFWDASLLVLLVGYGVALRFDKGRLQKAARRLEDLAGGRGKGSGQQRISRALTVLEKHTGTVDQRWAHSHRITGLATREPLLARIEADAMGTLGVITFMDFDRICAFDPAMGDRMLRELADRVRRMVGRDRLLAHVDRSHFAVWFGADISEAEAQSELSAISYALGSTITDSGKNFVPETRFHYGAYCASGEPAQAFLTQIISTCSASNAKGALPASAKVTASKVRDHYTIEQDLRGALQAGQLEMRYQPQIDSAAGRLCGAEALMRWNHPVRGMVSPTLFIPIVEAAGLVGEFGLWALNAACREASRWRASGFGELRVAVNVSSHQLARPDMLRLIERTLLRHALPPQALEIELTESAATQDISRAGELFEALRLLGIEIAIDDFGTGFSSLTALRSLSFDKIKIDREFVTDVDKRRDSRAICQSVIALGRGLGIRVLAEGVERFEEYTWLCQHGCTEFQGYYFSPPLIGDEFHALASNPRHFDALLDLSPRAAQGVLSQRLA